MTEKKNKDLTKREALVLSWKNRKDYKGYDKSKGSLFNSWRAKIYSKKGINAGFPEKWRTLEGFKEDVLEGWEHGKVLLRVDKTKPYSKENCFWGDKGEENLGRLAKLEYNGETKTLVEWAKECGLNYNGLRQRYFRGKNYTSEQILFGKNRSRWSKIPKDYTVSKTSIRSKASKMISSYKVKDKKMGFVDICDIDIDWMIENIITKSCVYCGDNKNVGCDRIDNNKGHTKDNVVPCCVVCNTARGNNFSFEEMKILGKTIKLIKDERSKAG